MLLMSDRKASMNGSTFLRNQLARFHDLLRRRDYVAGRQFSVVESCTTGAEMAKQPTNVLPQSLAPRGLSREQAAAYVGVSPSLFDMLVKDGRMPGPKRINSRAVWDRLRLDTAFEVLGDTEAAIEDDWKVAV
jgi:predicted DNA-binding transcriptional regulator AlpA